LARIEFWNGDICDLEVDAIVNPAERPVAGAPA
jgi:O-acetyl-ADP-ribose deacetylase (regulator of RNase III)